MKTVTKEINVYSFDELSEEIQEKVIDRMRENEFEFYINNILEDEMTEKAQELCKEYGITFDKIYYDFDYNNYAKVAIQGKIYKDKFIEMLEKSKQFTYVKIEQIKKHFSFNSICINIEGDHIKTTDDILVIYNNEPYYYYEDLEQDNIELALLYDKITDFIDDYIYNLIENDINKKLAEFGQDRLNYYYSNDFANDMFEMFLEEETLFLENGEEYVE